MDRCGLVYPIAVSAPLPANFTHERLLLRSATGCCGSNCEPLTIKPLAFGLDWSLNGHERPLGPFSNS